MLSRLTIENVVLIDRLDLEFGPGLTVLTGETGAGKSILLDALGLALGERADRRLVRRGEERGVVTASFEPPVGHPAYQALAAAELGGGDGEAIVVRRAVSSDGRARAALDDRPVSASLLRELAASLVQVNGQGAQAQLESEAAQRAILDAFAGAEEELAAVAAAHRALRAARSEVERCEAALDAARREEDWVRHRALELDALDPRPGEEETLDRRRRILAEREQALCELREVSERLDTAQRESERAARRLARMSANEPAGRAADAIEAGLIAFGEAAAALDEAAACYDVGADDREAIEERLFALKDASRKYRVGVEDLPALREASRDAEAEIDRIADGLSDARAEALDAERRYDAAASALGAKRRAAAGALERAVMRELPPLKLDAARFWASLRPLAEPGPAGGEQVAFEVAINKGQEPSALAKTASGGERSRLGLALAVALAGHLPAATLVFDEIDAGMGGAAADAVGERLARLARDRQVLAVTHAPQVAARADAHFVVSKRERGADTVTTIAELDREGRELELARMLSGAEITEAARIAARSLLDAPARRAAS